MYALVDANSFYASCETVFNPSLRNKAIIVLSNNDGCIVAANKRALAAGIPKFAPYFQVAEQCKKLGIIVRSSNYELYADLSASMMQIAAGFAPIQHVYSIDECFLQFNQLDATHQDWLEHGRLIRKSIYQQTRLPVGIGFGRSATQAKAANYAAKHIQGVNGVAVINNAEQNQWVLQQMQCQQVWGVGKKISQRLASMGITSAWQLSQLSPVLAQQQVNVLLSRTIRELNGEPCLQWDEVRQAKRQIFSTRSFGQRIFDKDAIKQALSQHASIVAHKARQQNSLVHKLLCFVHSSPFEAEPRYHKVLLNLATPSNDSRVLSKLALSGIDALFAANVPYYKAGLGALELSDASYYQPDLFSPSQDDPKLMACMDQINRKYGSHTLQLASQGANAVKAKWHLKRNQLSPRCTSRWSELPIIEC